ncbi:MAG: lysoplasmalogenase [Pyrinomonadaceae bacterium]
MLIRVLTLLVLISAALTIYAETRGPRRNVYLFKPLTTALIILIALQTKFAVSPFYRWMIVAGLVCSLAGDIFLMLPRDRFIQGLVSFLFAHIFYIAAFTSEGAHTLSVPIIFPFLIHGGAMLRLLWPSLGKLKLPVVIYMLIILLMAVQATSRFISTREMGSALAFVGALLFTASDSILAVDRFRGPVKSAQFLILSTYFVAQWLIALST